MKWKMAYYLSVLLLWLFFRNFPQWTEAIYSKGFYPYIARLSHFIFGWIPFSLGDTLYTLLGFFVLFYLGKHSKKIVKKPFWFIDKILFFSITLVFSFFMLWGFNYFRMPLADSLQINTKYTEKELFEATENCINQANALHQKLAKSELDKVDIPFTHNEIYKIASKSFPLNIDGLTDFSSFRSTKSSLYSLILTYMGYSGYLNPFTNEAQVNGMLTGYSTPVTTCHEIAHQMGYAAEEEANYIGFLASEKSENLHFKYSASLFALRYLLNEVAKVDREKYHDLLPKIRKGIFENYSETRRFWEQYENKAEPIFKASYDAFLKANKQEKGIESYNLVVGLLIHSKIEKLK